MKSTTGVALFVLAASSSAAYLPTDSTSTPLVARRQSTTVTAALPLSATSKHHDLHARGIDGEQLESALVKRGAMGDVFGSILSMAMPLIQQVLQLFIGLLPSILGSLSGAA